MTARHVCPGSGLRCFLAPCRPAASNQLIDSLKNANAASPRALLNSRLMVRTYLMKNAPTMVTTSQVLSRPVTFRPDTPSGT